MSICPRAYRGVRCQLSTGHTGAHQIKRKHLIVSWVEA